MTTDLSTLTNAELLLQIVVAKRKSVGECDGINHGPATCGIVEVPILSPELMRLPCHCVSFMECPNCRSFNDHSVQCKLGTYSHWCDDCQGRGWIPNPDPWAMKRALSAAGFYLAEYERLSDGNDVWGACCYVKGYPHIDVTDADPERARFLAVLKAFEEGGKRG